MGTLAFLFFAFAGTQVANASSVNSGGPTVPNPQILSFIALSFGFSLMVNAWVFYRISGGLFNPAVRILTSHGID
jgi:aquaporin related protein